MISSPKRFKVFLAVLSLAIAVAIPLAAQDKPAPAADPEKIYAAIVGDYLFDMGGQSMTIAFWVKEKKLYGAPRGQENEFAEIIPRDLANLKFDVTVPDGPFYEVYFLKDEAGKIAKCKLVAQGMEIIGDRIK